MIRSRCEGAVFVLSMLLAALSVPAAAGADGRAEARRLFALGERAYEAQQWDEALEAYTSAYEAAPLPGFLFNIGQCHRKLGNYEAAADFFRRYLEALPDAPNRTDAEDLLEEVEAHLTAPEPETPPPPPPRPPVPPAAPPPTESDGPAIGLPTWVTLGGGVALAAVSVLFALDLSAAQSDFDDPALDCARRPDRCKTLRDRGETAATLRTVFAVASGLALAGGGVLLVLDLRSGSPEQRADTSRGPRLSLGWGGVSLEGTF